MNKLVVFLIIISVGGFVSASEPVPVHSHRFCTEATLPEPYRTMTLNIRLDEETDDVVVFELYRGGELILLPSKMMSQLKDVELNTIEISHEMHRAEGEPAQSRFGVEGDWLHIVFEVGDRYRADKACDGKPCFKWGRDTVEITITKDKAVTLRRTDLRDTYGGWSEKIW